MKILGAIAGILLLAILVLFYLPIPLDTKILWMIYLWLPLVLFTGGAAVTLLPTLIIKLVTGIITVAIIAWMIKYLPEILADVLGG